MGIQVKHVVEEGVYINMEMWILSSSPVSEQDTYCVCIEYVKPCWQPLKEEIRCESFNGLLLEVTEGCG